MSRASKNDPESFVVSAYQNPYTGKLFAMEQKDAFLKELRASQRREKEEQQRERALLERQDFWAQLRSQVSTVEDIEAGFALLDRKVPSVWTGKDSTFSTGCTKEMRIALDVQQKQPELQIIGPAPERFFRRRDYGEGK